MNPGTGEAQRNDRQAAERTGRIVRLTTASAMMRLVFLGLVAALVAAGLTVSALSGAPDTPNRPTATAVFVGGVDLEWNDVSAADSYEVQLFTNSQWTDLPTGDIEIAFYGAGAIISGLDPTATLWFRLRASNTHGASEWSAYRQMASTTQFERADSPGPRTHWRSALPPSAERRKSAQR